MSILSSKRHTRRTRVVSYGTNDFDQTVGSVREALRRGHGKVFLFVGASDEQKREGLAKVSADDGLNIHQFKVPNLMGERLVETQGNLRETFDHADEDAAVLFFDEADVLLDPSRDEKADEEDAALSNYFFDRVTSYPGVCIVCFSSSRYVDRLEGHDVDVVVEF